MRKRLSTPSGVSLRLVQATSRTSSSASSSPTAGETKIALTVLITPLQTIAPKPILATPAPSSPPISAWLLLEGMPSTQVMTFHAIAPISAAKITCASITCAWTMPVPTVCATWRPKTAKAMKLKNAAQSTAYWGFNTRVETTVAIEFAASCRPFRKSNSSAMPIRPMRTGSERIMRGCLPVPNYHPGEGRGPIAKAAVTVRDPQLLPSPNWAPAFAGGVLWGSFRTETTRNERSIQPWPSPNWAPAFAGGV
ncbi:hypothetical protein SPHINGOT1_250023 [Sphingomonas sp. T1]|nr:hypothetical protein SPHINGOT1_250023 [Sphingomonas sp. T1]